MKVIKLYVTGRLKIIVKLYFVRKIRSHGRITIRDITKHFLITDCHKYLCQSSCMT